MKREERKCAEKQRKSVSFILFLDGESLGDVATGLIFRKTLHNLQEAVHFVGLPEFCCADHLHVHKRQKTPEY